jgi:hypothetical protein
MVGLTSANAYFRATNAGGEALTEFDGYWLIVRSKYFYSAADATTVVAAVVANVRAGDVEPH